MDIPKYHEFLTLHCDSCHREIRVPKRCRSRSCPCCSIARSLRVRHRMRFLIQNIELHNDVTWKHWTLTLRTENDLKTMIDHLVTSFRRLRQCPLWRHNVTAGFYVIEITRTHDGWHAHLHVVCTARYIPHKAMVHEWTRVSGSSVVWVTRPPRKKLLSYVTKYVTQPMTAPGHQIELDQAMHARRLWSPFGAAHAINLRCPPYVAHCSHCGSTSFTCLDFLHTEDVDALERSP